MQAKRIAGSPSPALSDDHLDCEVLHLMLAEPGWPWTLDEIGRTLQDHDAAIDAVRRLSEAGLVHRFEHFVFPTRTARRASELQVGSA